MTRKKVKLAWIMNDSSRKASLKKRRLGLIKKVNELSILCGVPACMIMYSPDESQPTVWPSSEVARYMIARFRSMPEMEQLKKMMNQETYLRERFNKSQEQVVKCHKKNRKAEMDHLMHQIFNLGRPIDSLSMSEMSGLAWMADEQMKAIRKRIDYLHQSPFTPGTTPPPPFQPLPPPPQDPSMADGTVQVGGGSGGFEPFPWDEWFVEYANNNTELFKPPAGTKSSDNMGYHQYHPYDDHFGGGSSSGVSVADMGTGSFLPGGSFKVTPTNMGLTDQFKAHGGSNNFGSYVTLSNMGQGLNPFVGHPGASSSGTAGTGQFGVPPTVIFKGNNNNNVFGPLPPYDGKNWPSP
ncbi:Transcription factor, MADS-box [Corchorus capsularis]|uniref:Transcription factor, MADS-box n=1 Tax=Corchorus capsularis TaxID=210143 RepID=A0A1R3HFQ0_COCAP|nr:Transcription factor, MADS-box [Corchorus capsularis]